jgi:hypothetical protein
MLDELSPRGARVIAVAPHTKSDVSAAVAGLESTIRDLDGRISWAFLEHGLVGHAPARPSF